MSTQLRHEGTHPVVLVDELDNEIGQIDKLDAHFPPGRLHRAVSVFLFDSWGRTLLQRRSQDKYHFRGRWANASCTHPSPGEAPRVAGMRRLREEMGVASDLRELGTFRYVARDPQSGLVEHELDHVLVGSHDGDPVPDPAEADDWAWIDANELRSRVARDDPELAPWVAHAIRTFPVLLGPAST